MSSITQDCSYLNQMITNPLLVSYQLNKVWTAQMLSQSPCIDKPVPMKDAFFLANSEVYKEKHRKSCWLEDRKFENLRQTIIRYFKKVMRKCLKLFAPLFELEDCHSQEKFQKRYFQHMKKFKAIYQIKENPIAEYQNLYILLKEVREDNYFASHNGDQFKSCNNKYVEWFFKRKNIPQLYKIHHDLSVKSKTYEKLLNSKLEENDISALSDFVISMLNK